MIDAKIVVLNLAYLGFIAFLPFPTRVLGDNPDQPASVALYASTVAIVALISGAMRIHAEHDDLFTDMGARELAQREKWFVTPAVFLGLHPRRVRQHHRGGARLALAAPASRASVESVHAALSGGIRDP